jgi:predicted outer membrane repeat protein
LERLEDRLTPAIFSVTNFDSSGTGSLAWAIDQANANSGPDSVVFDSAVFTAGNSTIALTQALPDIADDLTISGLGDTRITITRDLQAAPFGLLFVPTGVSVSLTRLTFSRGDVGLAGGAISSNGSLAIQDCIFEDNFSLGSGGAIYSGGSLLLRDCTFGRNSVTELEGGAVKALGSLTVERCTFALNNAINGSAIAFVGPGSVTITATTIANNSSNGGALFFSNGLGSQIVTITDSTIVNNQSGIIAEGAEATATLQLQNTLLANNTLDNVSIFGSADMMSLGHNFSDDNSGDFSAALSDLINASGVGPLTLADVGGTVPAILLAANSTARGIGIVVGDTDARGLPRSVSVAPDIGAVQTQGYAATIVSGDAQRTAVSTTFNGDLEVEVREVSTLVAIQGATLSFIAGGVPINFAGANSTTATTDEFGQAIVAAPTAEALPGNASVTVRFETQTLATFSLNVAGPTASYEFTTTAPLVYQGLPFEVRVRPLDAAGQAFPIDVTTVNFFGGGAGAILPPQTTIGSDDPPPQPDGSYLISNVRVNELGTTTILLRDNALREATLELNVLDALIVGSDELIDAGELFTRQGNTLPGALVRVRYDAAEAFEPVTVDSEGNFSLSRTYAAAGTHTVTVEAIIEGTTITDSFVLSVRELDLSSADGLARTTIPFSRSGTLVNPDLDTTIWADFGDGAGFQLVATNANDDPLEPFEFTLNHTYTNAGTFNVVVEARDQQGVLQTVSFNVSVAPAAVLDVGSDTAIGLGDLFTRIGTFEAGATVQVRYNSDLPFEPLTVGSDGSFQLSHNYAAPGVNRVLVEAVTSDGIQEVIQEFTVFVVSVNVGGDASIRVDQNFQRNGQIDGAAEEATAEVQFGSGPFVPVSVDSVGNFTLENTFTTPGTFLVTVRAFASGILAQETSFTLTVRPQPTLEAGDDAILEAGSELIRAGTIEADASLEADFGSGFESIPVNVDGSFELRRSYPTAGEFTIQLRGTTVDNIILTQTLVVNAVSLSVGADTLLIVNTELSRAGSFLGGGANASLQADFGTGTFVNVPLAGDGSFLLQNTFATLGPNTVRVRGFVDGVQAIERSFTVEVIATPAISAGPNLVTLDGSITSSGSVAGSRSAQVRYADDLPFEPLVLNADLSFSLAHTYASPGVYTVTVRSLNPITQEFLFDTARVNFVQLNVGGNGTAQTGTPFSRNGSFLGVGAEGSLRVRFGSGAFTNVALAADGSFNINNTFSTAGTFTVTLQGLVDGVLAIERSFDVEVTGNPVLILATNDEFLNAGNVFTRSGQFAPEGTVEVRIDNGTFTTVTMDALGNFTISQLFAEEGSFLVTVRASSVGSPDQSVSFFVDVLLPGIPTLPAVKETIPPGTTSVVEIPGASVVYTNSDNANFAAVIVAQVPIFVAAELDSSFVVDTGEVISAAYEVRTINASAGDSAIVNFSYFSLTDDIPRLTFFDRQTGQQVPVRATLFVVDTENRLITLRLDNLSIPRLVDLGGTVFTITVALPPIAPPAVPVIIPQPIPVSFADGSSAVRQFALLPAAMAMVGTTFDTLLPPELAAPAAFSGGPRSEETTSSRRFFSAELPLAPEESQNPAIRQLPEVAKQPQGVLVAPVSPSNTEPVLPPAEPPSESTKPTPDPKGSGTPEEEQSNIETPAMWSDEMFSNFESHFAEKELSSEPDDFVAVLPTVAEMRLSRTDGGEWLLGALAMLALPHVLAHSERPRNNENWESR